MDYSHLQDRIFKGMGAAARKYGVPCQLYRPAEIADPLQDKNKLLQVCVAFQPAGRGGEGHASPVWVATLDGSYTREGDYLVSEYGTYFIAMQRPTVPVKCVLVNRRLSLLRPTLAAQGSYNSSYDGGGLIICDSWPGNLSGGISVTAPFHSQVELSNRVLMLPSLLSAPRTGDLVTDDLDDRYIVETAEQNSMGWRLTIRAGSS